MEKKGIDGHLSAGKKYIYIPKVSKENVTRKRLNTIIDRVFSGNKISFAEYFVNSSRFSPDKLEELKQLISDKEKEEKGR
jgi:predicted transcriptional regulator